MITTEDYSYAERDGQDNWVIRLNKGDYMGTVFAFEMVRLNIPEDANMDDPDVEASISFDYNIIESPLDERELIVDDTFNEYIGEVLGHILEDAFSKGDYKIGND